jgi:UDP-GlcNAc:undecaprenyl-phosphate GlcNAc-1-phosphate transferase
MSGTATCLLAAAMAAGISLLLTPWMARTAGRIGLVDRPDGELKTQRAPVPYLGGLAVFVAFLAAAAALGELTRPALAILLGGTLVMALGLLDDMGRLSPWAKLAGQALAVSTAMKAGVGIHIVFFPGWLSLVLTFVWLLGVTNAFNLVDIMDGLAGGVGMAACAAFLVLSLSAGQTAEGLLAAALLGALAGFLRYNIHPARIYLGDAGSLFAGFVLGALALTGIYARGNQVALLAPLLILGVPLFDTLFVSVIRLRRGQSPLMGSPDHFPLRLRRWRFSVPQTVAVSWAAAVLLGAGGLAMVFGDEAAAVAVLAAASAAMLACALWLARTGADL